MIAAVGTVSMMAQETYENAKLATEDLNGTARYVGMGGAMDALGADISTIGTNPAGIGMFRKGMASVSFGVNSQQDAPDMFGASKTKMSFDQAGFVYSMRTDVDSWINFGFNFHKGTNFNYILGAADKFPVLQHIDENGNIQYHTASQNKLTYAKAKNGLLYPLSDKGGYYWNEPYASCSQLDDIYVKNQNYDSSGDSWYYDEADSYTLNRNQKGYISHYDINLSGNIHNKMYLGLTIGLQDVNYKHYGEYSEYYTIDNYTGLVSVSDDRIIDGTGVNLKAGIILRPIDESAFRIGAYVHTPTWYDLKTSNQTVIRGSIPYKDGNSYKNLSYSASSSESYEFKLYTPWKFGLSAGHTIGSQLALGATFEYADYGSLDTRYNTGRVYDGWGSYEDSESDEVMNRHTEETLKGVATLKLGAEFKPDPALAVRLGYNYVSPMYKMEGFKDGSLQTDGSYYSSATDYTNWKATNRITCGLGYKVGRMNVDVAYQYSATNGEFSPFTNYYDNDRTPDDWAADDNICNAVNVSNKRHQVLFTLGYTF